MPNFLFDLELSAAIRVDAATEAEARAMLAKAFDCADANFGAWPNGDPITGEVSLSTKAPELAEIDGEEPRSALSPRPGERLFAEEADEFGAWCEREGELPA